MDEMRIKCRINKELKEIKDLDTLYCIEEYIKESKPLDLHTYIGQEFDVYSQDTKDELEHEIREIYLEALGFFKPSFYYIDHYCELYVEGYSLDIWIHERGSLFNPSEIASVIFKLWTKELSFR